MSLINRLLQDLDNRLSDQSEELALPLHVHAVAAPARRRGWTAAAVWLLLLLACAIFAAVYLWKTDSRFKSKVDGLLESVGVVAPVIETRLPNPQIVQAKVDAALMVPVFQLSKELALLPMGAQPGSASEIKEVISRKESETANISAQPRNTEQEKLAAIVRLAAQENLAAQRKSATPSKSSLTKIAVQGKSAEKTKSPVAGSPAIDLVEVANSSAAIKPAASGKDNSVADIRAIAGQSEELEEVVILADLTPSPINRQTRALTAYERAENAFLQGVAHMRQGRMNGAEASFRSAIEEDRSHVSARQALIGILIDAGRNSDAEAVLVEALGVNPRQPQQAMILARLQVERGDLQAAMQTLERARDYAINDAGFISFQAAVLQRALRHDEAATQYRNALALVEGNAIWSMGLGISLRALGDTVGAKDAFGTSASAGTLNKDLQAFVAQQFSELDRAAKK